MGSHHHRSQHPIGPRLTTLLLFCGLSSLIHSVFTQSLSEHSLAKRQIDERRVVCYYANWAVYRQGTAKFTPQNINPYLCTHLIYAFAGLGKDDTIQTFDKYQDLEKGGYGQFAALKTYNRDLKTLIAIGGWNEGSRRFSPLVADPKRRKTFIKSAIRFLRQYNFDGLDLDWEYPTFRDGGKPEDRLNYAKFVIEMREAFESEAAKTGKDRLLITMAVPASLEYAGKGFDIKTLDKHLDFFNLLTYDYHSAYEPATNHHSPLYRPRDWSDFDFRADLNIDSTIQFYLKSGASRNKLVLGIPTYGRSYTLVNSQAHQIGSPTDGPGEAGKGTKEDGYLAYYEVCQSVQDEDGWEVESPYPGIMGPYAHKEKFWVGFDDEYIVREKSHFVNEENLGGIMFWTIDNDDFRGACGDRPFPLIEAAKEALFGKDAAIKTATSVSISTSEQTRIERLKLTRKQLADLASRAKSTTSITPRPQSSKTTSFNFNPVSFDPFSTPEPPTTPSSAPAYECKDEGFFPHTKSCKKYFWCLAVPGSGMVAHTFTCPQGLYFNSLTDGCDFRRNVDCEGKDDTEEEEDKTTASTTTRTTSSSSNANPGEAETLEDVLAQIKEAGGLEAFEEKLRLEEEAKEAAKKREEERRAEISKKTRSRLSELLDRKRAEVLQELERNGVSTETEPPKVEILGFKEEESEEPVTLRPNRFRPAAGSRKRLRNRLHEVLEEDESSTDENAPQRTNRIQNAARPNIASIRSRNPALNTETSSERPSEVAINRGLPPTALEEPEEPQKEDENSRVTPRPLEYVTIDRGSTGVEDNPFVTPLSTSATVEEQTEEPIEERPKSGVLRGNLEYVTIQRGQPNEDQQDDTKQPQIEEEESESEDRFVPSTTFRSLPLPTLPPQTSTSEIPITTQRPSNIRSSLLFLTNPNLSEEDFDEPQEIEIPVTSPRPILNSTPRNFVSSTTFRPQNEAFDAFNSLQPVTEKLRPEEQLFNTVQQQVVTRPKVDPFLNRRPLPRRPETRPTRPETRPTRPETPRRLENSRPPSVNLPIKSLPRDPVRLANRARQPPVRPVEPVRQLENNPSPIRQLEVQPNPIRQLEVTPIRQLEPFPAVTRGLEPVTFPTTEVTRPAQPVLRTRVPVATTPKPFTKLSDDGEYVYEYEYVYEDDPAGLVDQIDDYDLNPLTSKVGLLDNGKPVCHDVGVFPHPGSCRKFITCSRRAVGSGIVGWVYECPSYLAFDPVGGRCNWANEFVCQERRRL